MQTQTQFQTDKSTDRISLANYGRTYEYTFAPRHYSRSLTNSTALTYGRSYILYSSDVLPKGSKFGNISCLKNVSIGYECNPDSVIVTLLGVDIVESGENRHDALQNLLYFVTGILDDMRNDPQKRLSPRLAKQVDGLRNIFDYEPSDH